MSSLSAVLDTLSARELFDVLPVAAASTAQFVESDQTHRWESLDGDPREVEEIVSAPALSAGVTYWVKDALHALVLRQLARAEASPAEVLWDLETEQYVVMVTHSMSSVRE